MVLTPTPLRRNPTLAIVALGGAALAAVPACGDDAPTEADAGVCLVARADRYLPLAIGATWTFRVTPTIGTPEMKTSTVEALEDVGDRKAGVTGYRIRTGKIDGTTVSWQEDRCTSVARHREQSLDLANALVTDQFYVPDKLRIDETAAHVAMGASWAIAYTEIEVDAAGATTTRAKDETWTVLATAESVTVPAGTFDALKVRKITSGAADKVFWFAKGVGKIKEQGDQLEELVSFTLP